MMDREIIYMHSLHAINATTGTLKYVTQMKA